MPALEQGRDSGQTLKKAITAARRVRLEFEPFWKKYLAEIKGRQRRAGKGPRRLTNYAYLFESTLIPQLAAKSPDVWVDPVLAWSDAMVAEVEGLALAEIIRRQKFIRELQGCIQDGMYAFMYRKVGMYAADDSGDAAGLYGDPMWLDGAMPFFERVSPFDALWDDAADGFLRTVFCGQEFTRDLDAVKNDERYDAAARLMAEGKRALLRERTKAKYGAFMDDEIPPICNLIELFVRPTRQIYTLLEVGAEDFVVLRKAPFYGPAAGPFDMRAFHDNDEVTGMSPAAAWWDSYTEVEMNEQKADKQAQAEKRVVTTEEGDADSAKRYKAAQSDDLVWGVKGIKEVHTGGVTPERLAWRAERKADLEKLSGVSSTRIGVAQKGKSATAEYIAESNANSADDRKRRIVIEFAEDGLDGMRWYIHNTPSFGIRTTVTSPEGLPAEIGIRGGPAIDPMTGEPVPGQSPAEDFRTRIDAKSLYAEDDQLRESQAIQKSTFVLTTLRPFLMSQGMDLNAVGYIRQLEQCGKIEGLTRNIVPLSPIAMAMMQAAQAGAPSTESVGAAAKPGAGMGGEGGGGGGDPVQSQVMNSPETGASISNMARFVSAGRLASTPAGANNAETSPL